MPKAIVVGASSGIGAALARRMGREGWTLGLAARNAEALEALRAELGGGSPVRVLDVTRTSEVPEVLDDLASALGGVDCAVLSSGIGIFNNRLEWDPEGRTIATNVAGFVACATWAGRRFLEEKRGHLVGISSVASHRGSPFSPAYNASKAFISNYMEGLRLNLGRFGVAVTDVRPGYIATPMTEGQKGMFWVVSAERAADGIYRAILKRRRVAYVPRRWSAVALAARLAPDFLYRRFSN